MIQQFKEYLRATCQVKPEDKLLVACSGGVDSMVLTHLLRQMNQPIVVAHCNFQLRTEAAEDELFVKEYCKKQGLVFVSTQFDTKHFKAEWGMSTQMTARKLRYDWFAKVMAEQQCTSLAVAHHLEDSLETALGNLVRGTGPIGMRGILPKRDEVVRPLLFATKKQVIQYAESIGLQWREDRSNLSDDYQRNRIRHHVIPELENENPQFWSNAQRFLETQQEWVSFVEANVKSRLSEWGWPKSSVDVNKLSPHPKLWLTLMLGEFGYQYAQIVEMEKRLFTEETKVFLSDSHEVTLSRGQLTLSKKDSQKQLEFQANSLEELGELPFISRADIVDVGEFEFSGMKEKQAFCLDKIQWPLTFRTWKTGDKMKPLGMRGSKLVSDILTDDKVNAGEKRQVKVMVSGNDILWLLSGRMSDDYKVTSLSKRVLSITLKNV